MDSAPLPPSSPSSTSDTDAFNTSDARIHFGPLTSPEKKFASIVARCDLPQPSSTEHPQCSPRLSVPSPASPSLKLRSIAEEGDVLLDSDIENEMLEDTSWRETFENDQIAREEPSSALAIKIMRAHDNPSPPPGPPKTEFFLDFPSSSSLPTVAQAHASQSIDRNNAIPLNINHTNLAQPTPRTGNVTHHGLLSFQSFSTPAPVFRRISPRTPVSPLPQLSDNLFSDDMLMRSPSLEASSKSDVPKGTSSWPIRTTAGEFPENEPYKRTGMGVDSENSPKKSHESFSRPTPAYDSNILVNEQVTPQTPAQRLGHSRRNSIPYGVALASGDDEIRNEALPISLSNNQSEKRAIDHSQDKSGSEDENSIQSSHRDCSGPQANCTRKPVRARRDLGSLSPASNKLLGQLLASPTRISPTPVQENDQVHPPDPLSPQPSLSYVPQRFASPVRFSNLNVFQSPSKVRLQPVALDDLTRTPARRIPIEEAVAKGYAAPPEAPRLETSGRKIGFQPFKALSILPTDSPAKRVDISKVSTPAEVRRPDIRSPTRSISKGRPLSLEDQRASSSSNKLASLLGPLAAGSSAKLRTNDLPFPILPSRAYSGTIGGNEANGVRIASPSKARQLPALSPIKSNLKQITSKIPRVKPYARPASKVADTGKSVAIMRTVNLAKEMSKPAMPDPIASSSPDKVKPGQKPETSAPNLSTSTLKRKRDQGKPSSSNRPLRQVPQLSGFNVASKSRLGVLPSAAMPTKKPQHIRRVVDRPVGIPSGIKVINKPTITHEEEEQEMSKVAKSSVEKTPPSSPKPEREDISGGSPTDSAPRRTRRVRKPVIPTAVADVFGHSDGRTLPPRKKSDSQTLAQPDQAFSGMSAVALKTLTTSNTERNQKYTTAKLETEVIRKEGMRPESPTVKIRTIFQRRQDEKNKQRKQRAERRARRSEDGQAGDQSETEYPSETEDSSVLGFDSDSEKNLSVRKRHKRGPGDEEDYETPVRLNLAPVSSYRPADDGETGPRENVRRVKWDRGLSTTIYLDQVKLGARRPLKENVGMKGCLTSAAKTLPLDNLGNLPDTNVELGLTEECVVVKKFVYDNDVEPAPPTTPVKNTRLRSRKGKN